MNVYMPLNHPPAFMSKAFVLLAEFAYTQSVVGRNLNCLMDPLLDTFPEDGSSPSRRARLVAEICADL